MHEEKYDQKKFKKFKNKMLLKKTKSNNFW